MHSIHSRYRKPKGRPNKRKIAAAESAKKRVLQLPVETVPKNENNFSFPEITTGCNFSSNNDFSTSNTNEYILMSKSCLSRLLRNLQCNNCNNCSLDVLVHENYGFSVKLELICTTCEENFGSAFSSEREPYSRKFDVNSKVVTAFLNFGKGYAAIETFSKTVDCASMNKKTFSKCFGDLVKKNEVFREDMLKETRNAVRKAHLDSNPNLKSDDPLHISVSYDGTWQKRGHSSLYGIGIAIDTLTGLAVDYEIMSKYCQQCNITSRDLGEDSAEFHIWKEGHKPNCQKNFSGSSGSMEMVAASRIWKRSISLNNMLYTTIICDGDSKTFVHLNEEKIYGKIPIVKEECINHVAKRLGTALRNTVKDWRAKGVTLGGRKPGSLKDETIVKLQNFYRKAIKDNAPDINLMKTSIFATLYHCMSTDKKPQHSKCRKGISSWCFYQRALASNEVPQSHSLMKTKLTEKVVEKILPIYQRLASNEILLRCASAKTQNANESLHSCIWKKCSKDTFVSKNRLEYAVTLAISQYNFGNLNTLKIYSASSFSTTGFQTVKLAEKQDEIRLSQRKRRSSNSYKQLKKIKKFKKSKQNTKQEITYSAGAF